MTLGAAIVCPSLSVSHEACLTTPAPLKAPWRSESQAAPMSGCITTGTRAAGTGRAPILWTARLAASRASSSSGGSSPSQRLETP